MCCLFGILDYKNCLPIGKRVKYLHILANECEVRGTDATGIAYNDSQRLCIYKRPLPAHKMRFSLPPQTNKIMGHTRMTTQGSGEFNQNNHPFLGHAGTERFALAHNGILYNDLELREKYKLPVSKIETDSYVAVQMIEKRGVLNFDSLSKMAEAVCGSFTFTVMDSQNGIYFIKGNNPLVLYHWKELGLYIYASTETILKKALAQTDLPSHFENLPIEMGDILYIDAHGRRSHGHFNFDHLLWEKTKWSWDTTLFAKPYSEENYIRDLKSISYTFGFTPGDVDSMLANGMSAEDIEELYYCGVW